MTSAANSINFFRSSLRALQFAPVSYCARRLLKHFSCRSFRMMRTTDDLGVWLSSVIFHGLCCEFGACPLDSEPYRSRGQCFHPCGHFAVCRCYDVCPLCPRLWASWAACIIMVLILTVSHYSSSTDINFLLESYLRYWKPCLETMQYCYVVWDNVANKLPK